MSKNAIYCLVGKSGVGKTTIANFLTKHYGMKSVESYTTRPQRYEGETGHIFVTREEFAQLGSLCAYTEFDGNQYGVPASMVDECDLYVIDVAGVKYLREHYHGKEICVIGLDADENTLYARMLSRGDSENKATQRILHDREQFAHMEDVCDVIFGAYSVDLTVRNVMGFINKTEQKFKESVSA